MSKLFSISMATMLLLMTLAAPMQPANAMEDSPQTSTPVAEELPLDNASDGDDIVVQNDQASDDPPAEPGDVAVETPALTQTDEPAENANSPPVMNDSVAGDASATTTESPSVDVPNVEPTAEPTSEPGEVDPATEPMTAKQLVPTAEKSNLNDDAESNDDANPGLISPNAVDPRPGDCPVDEICDGGGGEPASIQVTIYVQRLGTAIPVDGATVKIYAPGGSLHSEHVTQNGMVSVSLTDGETYSVDVLAAGYFSRNGSIAVSGANNTLTVMLSAYPGSATIIVKDSQTGEPIEGAEVSYQLSGGMSGGGWILTDEFGHAVLNSLSVGITVTFTVTANGYVTSSGELTIPSGGSITIERPLDPTEMPMTVKVLDASTGTAIPGASISVEAAGAVLDSGTTSSEGVWKSVNLPAGTYVLNVSATDYAARVDQAVEHPSSGSVVISLEKESRSLKIEVVDSATKNPVPNAAITLRLTSGTSQAVAEGTTDANGRWDSGPLANNNYELTILSPNHRIFYATITDIPDSVRTIELDAGHETTATYTVLDFETDEPIENASVTATDYSSSTQFASGQTDATGNWTFNPVLGNAYWITIEKDGYQVSTTYALVNGDYSKTVRLMPPGYPGSITFQVYEANAFVEIPGATITLSNGTVTESLPTDDAGHASFVHVASGIYDLTIEANGYVTHVDTIEIKSNLTLQAIIELEPRPAANLEVQLQAPVAGAPIVLTNISAATSGNSGLTLNQVSTTLQPIAGQLIQVVNPDTGLVIAEGTTDATGLASLAIPRMGIYLVSVNVDGFEAYSSEYDMNEGTSLLIVLQPIVVDNPGEVTTPGTDNPDENTAPGTDAPVDTTTPGTGDPIEGPAPEPDVTDPIANTPNDPSNPVADVPGSDVVVSPGGDAEVSSSRESGSAVTVAQVTGDPRPEVSGQPAAATARVAQLPNTGAGEPQSNTVLAALSFLAGVTLLGALGVRRTHP